MHGGVRVTLQKAMCLRLSETWPSGGSAMPVSMKTLSCALHVPDLGLSGLLLTRWWSRVRRHFSHGPISTTFRPEHISPYVVIPAGGPAGRWVRLRHRSISPLIISSLQFALHAEAQLRGAAGDAHRFESSAAGRSS